METYGGPQETVVSSVLTLQDVLSSSGDLTQEQFAVLALDAQNQADSEKGARNKERVFDDTLVKHCSKFGDPIPRRFTTVTNASWPEKIEWFYSGERLLYLGKPGDYWFIAVVFP